jgi:drug/metabolite transporter (DMT)-like permease
MHYIFLVLSLLSSICIAISLRTFEHKGRERTVVIAANYITAVILGYILSTKANLNSTILIFGAILGLFFFVGFWVFSHAIKTKGVASSVTIGRLSLAIPVAFSIFLWGERPALLDIAGLLIIFFIIIAWEGKIGKVSPILMTLFMLFGLMDSAMKYFKLKYPEMDDSAFLIIVFCSAIVWSWGYIALKKIKPKPGDVIAGMLMGIPNFFSSFFMLKALALIPAFIVFPFLNVGMIILSALIGSFLFKESLNRKKIALLFLGIISVVVLTT